MNKADRAFTLAELLLAVSITAVAGLAAATLASGLSYAQSQTDSLSQAVQSGRNGMMRMDAAVRRACLVTGVSPGRLSLWMGDANADAQINVDELTYLVYVPETRTVESWQVAFPPTLSPALLAALNQALPLADLTSTQAVQNALSAAMYLPYLNKTVLATDVQDLEVATDVAAPFSRLVLLRLSVGGGRQRITLTNAARLRCDAVASVRMIAGVPVLALQ